jgi:hypothetical protein
MGTSVKRLVYVLIILIYLYEYIVFLNTTIPPSELTYISPIELFLGNIQHVCLRLVIMLLFLFVNFSTYGAWKKFNMFVPLPIALMRFFNEFLYIFTQIEIGFEPLLLIEFIISASLTIWVLREKQ